MLKFDNETLESTRKKYVQYSDDMRALRDTLKDSVDAIRESWKSEAGNEFFEKFEFEWLKCFNDYIKVIDHMASNMVIAKDKYQVVFDEAEKLNLHQ